MLVLFLVALWFILRDDLFYFLASFFYLFFLFIYFLFLVLLTLRLPRLGKGELIAVLFCRFVLFALVWFCLFSLPLGVWEGLRFVIVALPGLFSYLFYTQYKQLTRHCSPYCHVLNPMPIHIIYNKQVRSSMLSCI